MRVPSGVLCLSPPGPPVAGNNTRRCFLNGARSPPNFISATKVRLSNCGFLNNEINLRLSLATSFYLCAPLNGPSRCWLCVVLGFISRTSLYPVQWLAESPKLAVLFPDYLHSESSGFWYNTTELIENTIRIPFKSVVKNIKKRRARRQGGQNFI